MSKEGTSAAAHLEQLGFSIHGQQKMRQLFLKYRRPNTLATAIYKFQDESEIQAAKELTTKILSRVRELGDKADEKSEEKIQALLSKAFYTYSLPEFQPIVIELLNTCSEIPLKYLDIIVATPDFYSKCPLKVKRRVWMHNAELFEKDLMPLIDVYVSEKRLILYSVDQSATNFFTQETTKARRQHVHDIVILIGNNANLYETFVKIVREQFAATLCEHLCSLRMEVLMHAHDISYDKITKSDKIYDFAWCLDGCVRDKMFDSVVASKLRVLLDSIPSSSREIVTDMSMVVADPHLIHFLCNGLLKKVRDNTFNTVSHLPREMTTVHVMARLLTLAIHSKDIASKKDFTIKSLDPKFFTGFLAELTTMLYQDHIRTDMLRADIEEIDDITIGQVTAAPPIPFLHSLRSNELESLIWFHQCLEVLPHNSYNGDAQVVARYVMHMPVLYEQMSTKPIWCHLLAHKLIYSNQYEQLLTEPAFHQIFMDEVLFHNLEEDEAAKYQIMRLINQIGFIWGVERCLEMMDTIKPAAKRCKIRDAFDEQYFRHEFNRVMTKLNPHYREFL